MNTELIISFSGKAAREVKKKIYSRFIEIDNRRFYVKFEKMRTMREY